MAILFDSDFILSLLFEEESTHEAAKKTYSSLSVDDECVLPYVHYELITVCSRKYGHAAAKQLHGFISTRLKRVNIEGLEDNIWKEFFSHQKKSISFIDCANLVVARKYGWKIASFDAFYPKSVRV